MEPAQGSVASLFRHPVKSMRGEELGELTVHTAGVAGDRVFAVVDRADGRVASAKHPRKWGRLLELCATYADEPGATPEPGMLRIAFPDGTTLAGDSPRLDAELTRYTGRDVTLVAGPLERRASESVWLDIDGAAPQVVVDAISGGRTEDGAAVGDIPVGSESGSFVDVAAVHIMTTGTLRALAGASPGTIADVRRFRPNILIDLPDGGPGALGGSGAPGVPAGFPENDWTGAAVGFPTGAELAVTTPTVRCVMTTLAQGDLPQDRDVLRTLARVNRLDLPQFGGRWACAGAYADVTRPGVIRRGDPVRTFRPAVPGGEAEPAYR